MEADASAFELLSGSADPTVHDLSASALKIALWVAKEGPYLGIDPGILALLYGKASHRWGVTENALKHLSFPNQGPDMIAEAFRKRFNPKDLPESSERFLSVLSS